MQLPFSFPEKYFFFKSQVNRNLQSISFRKMIRYVFHSQKSILKIIYIFYFIWKTKILLRWEAEFIDNFMWVGNLKWKIWKKNASFMFKKS